MNGFRGYTQGAVNLWVAMPHTPVVCSIWGSWNALKILVQVEWLLKNYWHLKYKTTLCLYPWRECVPCQHPGRTCQWCERMLKVCWFWASFPWCLNLNMKKPVSADVRVNHIFFWLQHWFQGVLCLEQPDFYGLQLCHNIPATGCPWGP